LSARVPDVTSIEVKPVAAPQAESNWVPVWLEYVAAVELAPWSEPENEPVTLAVPPGAGRMNPSPPEGPDAPV
jgi:hypothetical protein